MKKYLGLLCIVAVLFAASFIVSSDSQTWVLVHKVEFYLLLFALIVACLIHPAETGQVSNDYRTLRYDLSG